MAPVREVTYGLLGRTLGHSWSPKIHAALGSAPYQLIELEPDEVTPYIRSGNWKGLNVTIPYKRVAAEAADVRSPRVEALGVANALVHLDDGRIFADNTDVLGFSTLLEYFCRERLETTPRAMFAGKKALVLGTGGAAQAVSYALREMVGCEVAFISRSGTSTYENLLELHADAALIVNTTPVGMYPNCPASPLKDGVLEQLPQLQGVLDVIYNPTRTGLCQQAERVGIPAESGLAMLVWQAVYASELFQGKDLDGSLAARIIADITLETGNVVLIGMPGAGKTSSGRALARMTRRPFIDLDDAFSVETGIDPATFIKTYGEDAFREQETAILKGYASRAGLVIACGGGVVTRPENYAPLHQNGTIVMIDRNLSELSSKNRPISQTRGILKLAEERMALYRDWADVVLPCTGSPAGDAELIRRSLGL